MQIVWQKVKRAINVEKKIISEKSAKRSSVIQIQGVAGHK
jgi:hypothetical protein